MQSVAPCRVIFLDDNAQDIELMKHELDSFGFNYISKWVSSKKDFLYALDNFKPDIILADYDLPMFNGMHAFRLFKQKQIAIPFILVTGSLSEQLAMECLSEGIDDFMLKSGLKRLPMMISRNLEIKQTALDRETVTAELEKRNEELRILREKVEKDRARELLSNREFEILCFIATGKSIKEIAGQLFLSPATVATYRARILEKLNLRTNVDLTRYAIQFNLIK